MTSRLDTLKGKFVQVKEPTRDAVCEYGSNRNTVNDIIANIRNRGGSRILDGIN